jgi:hypothetical protein
MPVQLSEPNARYPPVHVILVASICDAGAGRAAPPHSAGADGRSAARGKDVKARKRTGTSHVGNVSAKRRLSALREGMIKAMAAKAGARAKCTQRSEGKGRRKCHRHVGHRGPHHADSGLVWGGRRRGTRIRARHYRDCPGHGGFMLVAALFFPRAWAPWLIFLNVICLYAVFAVPARFSWIPFAMAMLAQAGFFFVGLRIRVTRKGRLFRLRGEPNVRSIYVPLAFVILSLLVGVILLRLLSVLVASGQNVATAPNEATIGISVVVLMAIPLVMAWLLFGVPAQAHRIGVDKDGYTQRFVVGVVATVTCVLTGVFFVMLHVGGLLGGMAFDPLIVGIVFTCALVWPFYRSLARTIWQRGIRGVFGLTALKEPWGKISREVRVALDEHAEDEATACNEKASAAEGLDRNIPTPRQTPHVRR